MWQHYLDPLVAIKRSNEDYIDYIQALQKIHPCEKSNRDFFPNQIWLRLLDMNILWLACFKKSIEEVKKRQISERGYQLGAEWCDETLTNAWCQFTVWSSVTELWRWWVYLTIKYAILSKFPLSFTNRWSNVVVSWFLTLFCKMIGKMKIFYHRHKDMTKWPKGDIDMRINSGTVGKWLNIVVTSLIWHMTSLGLNYSPDSTM